MIATQLKLDIHLALSTLIHVSTHRFPVLELRVAALDSEGVDIVFPLEAVRDYLDGSGPLIDPRTGEAFQRVDDVRIAFVAAGIAP